MTLILSCAARPANGGKSLRVGALAGRHPRAGQARRACRGGVSYFDCACLDFRLVIETLKSAEDQGADLLNYAELCATPVAAQDAIFESTVRDGLTNEIHRVRSRPAR